MRRRPRFVLVGVGVALVAVGVLRWEAARREESARAREVTLVLASRLATCVLGDPTGLDEGRARRVVRGSQLTAMALSPEQRLAEPELAWPRRCAPYARLVAEDERDERRKQHAPSGSGVADTLAAAFEEPDSDVTDWTPLLFAWLDQEHGALRRADDVPVPPPEAGAETVDSLDPHARILPPGVALAHVHFAPFLDDRIDFVVDDWGGSTFSAYCTYTHEDARARCTPMPGLVDPRPYGTRDQGARPLVSAADGLYDALSGDKVPIDVHAMYGASSRAQGIAVLAAKTYPPQLFLFRLEHAGEGAKVFETPLWYRSTIGDPDYNVALLWGTIVSKRTVPGAQGLRLRAQDVTVPEQSVVWPDDDIGQVGETSRHEALGEEGDLAHLQGCERNGARVLRVRGWDAEYFSFRAATPGAEWTRPIELDGVAGASGGAMTCQPGVATILDVRGHPEGGTYQPVLTSSRCVASSVCETTRLPTRDVFAKNVSVAPLGPRDVAAAAVDEKVLLVWRAGKHGGLRMRLGPLTELPAQTDVVLFDDHERSGAVWPDSTLKDFRLKAVPGGALLLLETPVGTYLYRIGPRLEPVTLQ